METLFRRHDQYIAKTPMDIVRETMQDIGWDSRLIAIVGARGVGKSTLMRQYVKLNFEPYDRSVLYCSLDSVYFSTHTVIELAEGFVAGVGRRGGGRSRTRGRRPEQDAGAAARSGDWGIL